MKGSVPINPDLPIQEVLVDLCWKNFRQLRIVKPTCIPLSVTSRIKQIGQNWSV
jgi:hypothetical protein